MTEKHFFNNPAHAWDEDLTDFPEFCGVWKFRADRKVQWCATVTLHGQNQDTAPYDTPAEAIKAAYALVKDAPTPADVIGQRDALIRAGRAVLQSYLNFGGDYKEVGERADGRAMDALRDAILKAEENEG